MRHEKGEEDMKSGLLISDAAKEVQVESHVLRYWEEELGLPIRRNEQGHRYYTDEDVECFRRIKLMKERGLQLKAIKMILRDGKFDILPGEDISRSEIAVGQAVAAERENTADEGSETDGGSLAEQESKAQRMQRLQWVLQQMVGQAVRENNAELVQQIRESVLKELDYQFRLQEEREEERDRKAMERAEQHYRQVDELLRLKSKRHLLSERLERRAGHSPECGTETETTTAETPASGKAAETDTMESVKENLKKRFLFGENNGLRRKWRRTSESSRDA